MAINYQVNPIISVHDLIDILKKSTLGLRRPLADLEAMESMLAHANYYIGAYENGQLVGLARAMTDFVYTTYLADLAVDEKYQHQGIGKELIKYCTKTNINHFSPTSVLCNILDINTLNQKCICDKTILKKKYSCSCYYLRHPLNPNIQYMPVSFFLQRLE